MNCTCELRNKGNLSEFRRTVKEREIDAHSVNLPRARTMQENAATGSEAIVVDRDRHAVYPEWVYPYSAGILGGLIGGLGVAGVGLGYGVYSGNLWLPVNVVAAAILRNLQSQSAEVLARFDPAALIIGLLIHALMSISLGLMFAFILPALPGRPLYWGPVIGPLLWVGGYVAALPLLNPIMVRNLEINSFTIANILFGILLGWWMDRTPMVHVDR